MGKTTFDLNDLDYLVWCSMVLNSKQSIFFLVFLFIVPLLFSNASLKYPYLEASIDRYIGNDYWGYALSSTGGVLYYNDSEGGWFSRNEGLPHKVVYPFTDSPLRKLVSLGVSPSDSSIVATTDGQSVFISENGGFFWSKLKNKGDLSAAIFITAIYPVSKSLLYLGTGGTGIFEGRVLGDTVHWRKLSKSSDDYYLGAGNYEQVQSFWVQEGSQSKLFVSFAFGAGVYSRKINLTLDRPFLRERDTQWKKIPLPFSDDVKDFHGDYSILSCFTDNEVYRLNLLTGEWLPGSIQILKEKVSLSLEEQMRREKAENREGIYIRWDKAANETTFTNLLKIIKREGYNSFVVDLKNDNGVLTYDSNIEEAKALGAINPVIDIKQMVQIAHQNGIYVIARIVVFKDRNFFHYKDKAYAVWNKEKNAPWGYFRSYTDKETGEKKSSQKEFWVDPFAQEVWEYNAKIAVEIQNHGVDEIQFDYIRFPSDGPIREITYRHQKPGMRRMDALESFLTYVREVVTIPISTDLYGFQSYFLMGNHIGQNIELFSNYVDVISPMFYPSHFPNRFLPISDYHEWSRVLYQKGSNRAYLLTEGKVIIRPYIQAFLMPAELRMKNLDYRLYLKQQIEGTKDSFASGFTLWNNSNIYYMLD